MFPLRDGFFKPLQFAPEDLASWKELVVGLVDRTLVEEAPVVATQYEGGVDTRQWKHVKTRDQLRVFQPRSGSVAAINAPCVLAVGTIEGTLEDVIYGIHNTTTRDIRVTRAFLSDSSLDSAVLHVFENGSDDDPFRSLALKWRVVATPAGNLVKNRDGCMLEYMGISRDEHGRRFAFQVSENLDHPICPRFTDQGVVRAEVHIRAIYRELDAGRVGVYFHGGYNMSGHIPKFLASWTAAAVASSVGKSVECAEAKKLTALALSKTHVALRQQRHRQNRLSSVKECAICKTNPSILSSSHECDVCSSVVCSKCSSHKHVLSETTKIRVNCCKQCIVAAKSVIVDPRKPLKLVSSGLWVSRGVLSATSARSAEPELKIPGCNETMSARQRSLDPSEDVETQNKDTQHPKYGRMSAFETREPAPTASVRRHSDENTEQVHPEMWMQMLELRKAAEQTYRLTKEVNKLMAPEPLTRAYTR